MVKITHADGSTVTTVYFDGINTIEVTNELGNTTRYAYDGFGNITQTADLRTNTVLASYSYDSLLRLQSKTDGAGHTTSYQYDYLDRATQKTIGGIYTETYQYDDAYTTDYARVTKTIIGDANAPDLITFTDTDNLGRTVHAGRIDGAAVYTDSYSYDYLGHQTSTLTAKDQAQGYPYTALYTTDVQGNVLTVTQEQDNNSNVQIIYRYTYDLLSRKISATDPKGNTTTYSYDEHGNLLTQQSPLSGGDQITETYTYDPKGNRITQQISSGLAGSGEQRRTEYIYNNRDQLIQTTVYDGTAPYYTAYAYDLAGNKTGMTTGNGQHTTSYAYDSMRRLVKQTDPLGQSQSYTYDGNGNLIQTIDRNKNKTVNSYNALNLQTQSTVTTPDGKTQTNSYAYTATGAKLTAGNETQTATYQYDNLGRTTNVTVNNGTALNYSYDLANNRIASQLKINNTVRQTVAYTYDKQNRMTSAQETVNYQYDLNGNRSKTTYGNGITSSYEYNQANLITKLTNQQNSGAVISQYQYNLLPGRQPSH